MNFIFFSIHFPAFNQEFSHHLHRLGANVLGIGDTEYNNLSDRLKASLNDYYRISDLGNYDEILRAVGYFTHKYGKIDRFESLNEHWLEMEARIRTDFNIEGIKADSVDVIRKKSRMKEYFEKSGVATIPYVVASGYDKVLAFAGKVGYPIILKPDKGSGAANTRKVMNPVELQNFFEEVPEDMEFIAEQFIDGDIVTYDGLIGRDGKILFESSSTYNGSIMDVVNFDDHVHYISHPKVPTDVRRAGAKIIRSFGVRERFFHLEMFRSRQTGEIIALEINMRPPGAWMTDAINFSHDMDIYSEWANMVVNGRVDGPFTGKYFTAYASRKNHKRYHHTHETILQKMNGLLLKHEAIEPIFSRAMGNYAYQFRSKSLSELRQYIGFIQAEVDE